MVTDWEIGLEYLEWLNINTRYIFLVNILSGYFRVDLWADMGTTNKAKTHDMSWSLFILNLGLNVWPRHKIIICNDVHIYVYVRLSVWQNWHKYLSFMNRRSRRLTERTEGKQRKALYKLQIKNINFYYISLCLW